MAKKRARLSKGIQAATKEAKSKGKKSKSVAPSKSTKKQANSPDTKAQRKNTAGPRKQESDHAKDGQSENPERNGHVKKRDRQPSSKAKSKGGKGGKGKHKASPRSKQLLSRDRQLGTTVASTLHSLLESYAKAHELGRVASGAPCVGKN